ncbi:SGNH/GDSL hydrolase family protein [Sediminibacterium ginsengisoli]|uniref:Lysophospholipase L1 n=1 Tax=Sediminibacterium ginsengisoli TaxID=413434 RepID=A0A1T4RKL3_9BACT|nr:SGNH/GDSL hydrolase family protein [Sediminibacterium ginsengisoli]SKA16515.1 Lysophospholipase L1 [Sediminibacterium ginsengisoli]
MRILFTGDSITRGSTGTGFVQGIAQALPGCSVQNLGCNGDTMQMICNKLIAALKLDNRYDAVVLQGGYNDILLPCFRSRKGLFGMAFRSQQKKGIIAAEDVHTFKVRLIQAMNKIRLLFPGRLIITTIGCINESLSSQLQKTRNSYNDVLREIASVYNAELADTAVPFDHYLSSHKQNDYCVESFFAVTISDPLLSCLPGGVAILSRYRKLHLTTDGVHLNKKGAAIFKSCISARLMETGA